MRSGTAPAWFNSARMVFIPETDDEEYCGSVAAEPGDLRLLSLSNCDHELICVAVCCSLRRICDNTVREAQGGFRRGKLLTDSVLFLSAFIERHLILGAPLLAQILMDNKAAFPSVLWSWVFFVLEKMGYPWWLVNAVKALYHGSSVALSLGSTAGPGFLLSSGINQGCPMSGGIWCLIFDPFVRDLVFALRSLDASLSAFPDDIGIPCGDLCECLRAIVPVLDLMSCAAGLALNWKKRVFIIFSHCSDFGFRKKVEQAVPFASAPEMERAARYLGFMSGPDALRAAWKRPCRRSLAFARHVRSLGPSLVEVVVAFNVFVVSILTCHFQLVPLCSEVINDFGITIDVATATPRFSLGSGVLSHLRLLGFHVGIHHLAVTARASAYRTAKQSEVFCDLCDMLDVAADSDDAILYPRQAEWRLSFPISLLRKIVMEVEVVLGMVGLPSGDLQGRFVGVLSELEGGELVKVLARRIEHLGFEWCWPRISFEF